MHESLEEYTWFQELDAPGRRLISRAMHVIDSDYGATQDTVVPPYYYHNGIHTRMACEDLAVLRDTLGFTNPEFMVAASAMAAHDVVKTFDRETGLDEEESADWLDAELCEVPGITRVQLTMGYLAVIGTTPRFSEGTIVQKAVEQAYPTKRAELIAHAVAGADVGRLFTPEGPLLAHRLYQEMQAVAGRGADSIESLVPFQDSQIEFLVNYRYPRRDIEATLATHKAPVIRYLGKLSRMLEQGTIETWEQLVGLDKLFIASSL